MYCADSVESTEDVNLSHGGLLLVALLSKGDYSDGLDACGLQTCTALAHCGFGDRLLGAVMDLEGGDMDQELARIILDMKAELSSNSMGILAARNPKLASSLTADHFSRDKIAAYFHPVITSVNTPIPQWLLREPNIPQLSTFCTQTFGWVSNTLENKVRNSLWPGIFLRMICLVRTTLFSNRYNTQFIFSHCSHIAMLRRCV